MKEDVLTNLSMQFTSKSNCGVRYAVLLSIPSLLMVLTVLSYLNVIPFKMEPHSVVMIGIVFIIYLFFIPNNGYFASCKMRKNFLGVRAELHEYMEKNSLEIAGYTKANASLDEFLATTAKKLRNENFASIAAGVFPTLGILGTFISIAISMPDFSAQTSEVLEREISILLGGIGTAFYVSIYGIFLSIWWIFFDKTGLSKFQKDAKTIHYAMKDYFWQKEEIEQTYFRKSMENYEKLNTVFDAFTSQEFLKNLNETIAQRMNIFQTIIEQEEVASKQVSNILQNATAQLASVSEQQNSLQKSLGELIAKFSEFSEQIHTNDESFLQAHKVLGKDFEKAVYVAEILGENTQKLNTAIAHINGDNIESVYAGVMENIASMKKELDEIGDKFEHRIDDFDTKFLNKLQNTLQLIDSETAQIIAQISKLRD